MAIDLRLPNITSKTPEGKTEQLKSYIYQLVQELNWALNAVIEEAKNESASSDDGASNSPQVIFNKIKPLIMNSKDIVDAFYYSIKTKYGIDYTPVNGELTTFAESCGNGVTNIQVDYFPESRFEDISMGTINKFGNGIVIQLTSTYTGKIAIKHYNTEASTWSDWRYLIPSAPAIDGDEGEV